MGPISCTCPSKNQVLHLPLLSPHTDPWRLRDIQKKKIQKHKICVSGTNVTILGILGIGYQNDPDGTRNDFG